uniref:Copalyl pyrophosphate synthase-like protein n=1 Tax=Taiwania cryptomerioides TaxID=50187 RepID=A0A1D5AJD7_TAICR|nr:copalyl pyrophosphate synthase-like protein [Taiwania cryptomerioides]
MSIGTASAALFSFSSTMNSLSNGSLSCRVIAKLNGSKQRYTLQQPSFVGVGRRVFSKQADRSQWGKIVACSGEGTVSTIATDSYILLKREFPPAFWTEEMIDSIISSYDDQNAAEKEKRMQTLIVEIKAMFQSMGDGETNPSAYDTAWVARVPAVDGSNHPQFPQTLQWILQNQLSDGSWGEQLCFLTYDRILATLACVITLTLWHTGDAQVKKGIEFIKKNAERMEGEADNHRPSGFEIVFISMLNEAKILGLDLPYQLPFFMLINEMRETKLKKIPLNVVHSIPTTILYSLEGLQEIIDWDKIMKLQSKNGSFLGSPASTAAVFMRTGDQKCLDFLALVLNKFGDHAPCNYPFDLFQRIWAVDTVERLGIDRHFKKEIKETLDYVYMYWDERGIGWARDNAIGDIDDTAMGLRILRLHGYNVSSEALKTFRDANGEFFCFMGETQRGVTDMLNVHRCSQVAFPGEKIMEEAKLCTQRYLTNALESVGTFDKWALKKDLRGEVEYVLKYPWHRSLPRVEARSYIEQYGANDVWLGKSMYLLPCVSNPKYLELAKLDFNSVQCIQRKEIQELQRWWKASGLAKLDFYPHRLVEIYFAVAASMFEPEFALCRAVYTKVSIFVVILKYFLEAYATSGQDVTLFSEAVTRWDLSLVDVMPQEMKTCFLSLYKTINEIALQGSKRQGHDVLPYIRNLMEIQVASHIREAKWVQDKYVPSLNEYMENAKISMGLGTIVMASMIFTEDFLSSNALSKIGHGSKFIHLISLTGCLIYDSKTYEENKIRGKPCAIQCCLKDYPRISIEEALNHIYALMQNALLELNWDFTNSDMPKSYRKLFFNTARAMQFFFMEKDGFTLSHLEMQKHVKKCVFEPIL